MSIGGLDQRSYEIEERLYVGREVVEVLLCRLLIPVKFGDDPPQEQPLFWGYSLFSEPCGLQRAQQTTFSFSNWELSYFIQVSNQDGFLIQHCFSGFWRICHKNLLI